MKHIKVRQLNVKGFSHHVLIAALVISGIAGFGAWRVFSSSAATNYAGICGTGYVLKTTQSFRNGRILVYVKSKGSATDWCAFTVRSGAASGVAGKTLIRVASGMTTSARSSIDEGRYKYYAGPTRLSNSSSSYIGGLVGLNGEQHSAKGLMLGN